ncbi:hypothetical protein HPP92_016571 [Vanilla planifolia]|uniref:Protein kinase domain-containing protein n=1 Tax=Vanilla planifolia TaxID=51239 RepID=A0A835QF20_VANPL|nr:hypothetical protein HPP92_016571 [Vanilla planifolia]
MATERKKYPIRAEDYELYEMVGQGVSAGVHRALCLPFNEVVAIKILDFERHGSDLSNISREAQTMILIDHANVLKAHCSFVNGHNLWVVMPYMAGGSCLHIMKSVFPDGFEELVIATILKEVLKGLDYLHHHGHIHRDVKAGNILVDGKGGIKLGDFGVSACLFDSGDRQRSRNTFVGTPCWMAPEVMEQLHGYDCKADIWSFGITALELAHGHAPFSKYPPMKVLLMTLQNAPPCLDYERDRKFSRNFKHMIASCLVKDPSKRPTAHDLLKHNFFKQARSHDYIARKVLEGLPALGERYKALKEKEEKLLAQKKMPDGKKEEISQNEYKRGISGWNFDIEDLKSQASLIPGDEDVNAIKDQGGSSSFFDSENLQEKSSDRCYSRISSFKEYDNIQTSDGLMLSSMEGNKIDRSDNELKGLKKSDQQGALQQQKSESSNIFVGSCDKGEQKSSSTCLANIPLLSKQESLKQLNQQRNMTDSTVFSGEISHATSELSSEVVSKGSKSAASNVDEPDEKSKTPIVQQKGRFKVTSESVDFDKTLSVGLQKSHSVQVISQLQQQSLSPFVDGLPSSASTILQSILQCNIVQRDHILNALKQISTNDTLAGRSLDGASSLSPTTNLEKSLLEAAHDREKELLQEISELHWRLVCLQDENQRLKAKNAQ